MSNHSNRAQPEFCRPVKPVMKRVIRVGGAILAILLCVSPGVSHAAPFTPGVPDVGGIRLQPDRLLVGDRLNPGESISTPDTTPGNEHLVVYFELLEDGDLLIEAWNEAGHGGSQKWRSDTGGNPGSHVEMQADGNLVLYDKDQRALWDTKTAGNPGAYAVIQGDRNLVVRDLAGRVIWSTDVN